MKIVVTGAGGFVGRALIGSLAEHDIVAVDTDLRGAAGVEGSIADPAVLATAFAHGCDAVFHLATVPGGAAETDPDVAKSINVDATMALIEAAAQVGNCPRIIFASSIAVFGNPLPPRVDDDTPLAPRMIYGAHKAMMETWIDTQTRRGAINGISLRLPGVVARPKGPSGMKSAFMSDLFHALAAHLPIALPVSPKATMWLTSVGTVARNLAHALDAEATGAMTLPALRVTMAALAAEVAAATGADDTLVTYKPDVPLEAEFGRQPSLATPRADAAGFLHDGSVGQLVAASLAALA